MKLQEELNYLKGFIQLSKEEAVKRDLLEGFLSDRNKCLYLDADSILFKVAHYHLEEQDFEVMYEDYHTQVREIVNRIEEEGFVIDYVTHFFSTCSNNFRYEVDSSYKANREKTPLTEIVKHFKWYVISVLEAEGELTKYSDTLEADDLIAWGVELNEENYPIVASIDKDLKQIPCAHFDYYKINVKDEEGNVVTVFKVDDNGELKETILTDFRGFSYTTPQEGRELLLKQLLEGDTSDNIKGVKGIGKVKAEKALKGKSEFIQLLTVARLYNDMERLRTNLKLMKL
jgi:5'-3' exonuclease